MQNHYWERVQSQEYSKEASWQAWQVEVDPYTMESKDVSHADYKLKSGK